MKPHSDSAFSDSSLRSLYKTRDLLVSDCEEVSNHEFYNLIDKIDMNNPALQFKKNITTNIDKEPNSNNKNEKFKYKPRFLFHKYDDPVEHTESKTANDVENMNKMTNSMKNLIDEMQLKKIISLTAVLKSNQTNVIGNPASRELVKNVLDVELPKQINKIISSRTTANKLEKLSTELYLLGVGDEGEKDDQDVNQADDEMSVTNVNRALSRIHHSSIIPENTPKDQVKQKSSDNKFRTFRLTEKNEEFINNQSNLSRPTNFILPSYQTHVAPIYPRKIHKIEKRIKNLEKLMKKLKLNVKSLHQRVISTSELASNNIDKVEENKENIITTSNMKLYSSTRVLAHASNCSSKQMENVYDEIFYEFRQRKMNLLHYKKSERSLLFNQYPILKWNKPVINFAIEDYKLPPRPRFIRE